MKHARLTFHAVRLLLRYDPQTGVFTWRESRGRVREGQRAGTISRFAHGGKCRMLMIARHHVPAQRVAWLLMTGKWPRHMVGFKNGDALDCRWSNLINLTQRIKTLRAKAKPSSESGIRGVGFLKREKRWRARILRGSKAKPLGYHTSKDDAVKARERAVTSAVKRSQPRARPQQASPPAPAPPSPQPRPRQPQRPQASPPPSPRRQRRERHPPAPYRPQ